MGADFDQVPIRLTAAYRAAQSDAMFLNWLRTQEAAMDAQFVVYDAPQVRDTMFTGDSLLPVEGRLLELYDRDSAAWSPAGSVHRTMRFVYYIGETFRRAFDGTWVAIPAHQDRHVKRPLRPAVDLPHREGLFTPTSLAHLALVRRTGVEVSRVFAGQERAFRQWCAAGRPERDVRSTLSDTE